MLVTGNKICYDAHKNIARMKNFSSWHFGSFLPSAYCIRNFRRGLTCFAKYIIEGEKEMSTSMTKGSPLKLMLSFLKSLKDNLKGIDYIEHKKYLEERCRSFEKYKEEVELSDRIYK